ncbi:MAG: tRNA lysidine(34) synthetase TilS [Pyramidobacter sp.]|nr:tRNA lysidine(34) synthetase TilS [Pyramidobacter sp.]
MKKNNLQQRFRRVLEENGWLTDRRYLLGVSGGSDSMALLHLCRAVLPASRIVVAHMDHGLRDTSERDRVFVSSVCEELGVRCVAEKRDVSLLARAGESVEAAGRRLRYEFYDQARLALDCEFVALGHTRTDLAESVFMNIARGSGLRGLAGIPPRRGPFIRPLLGFYREELREYLTENGLSWVEDETNDLDLYQRNRVRNTVLPELRASANPRIVEHLAALGEEALIWRRENEERCRKLCAETSLNDREWPSFDLRRLRRLRPFERTELLRYIGRKLELNALPRKRTEELSQLIATSGRWVFQWGSEVDLTACGGVLRWSPATEKRCDAVEASVGRTVRWGGWNVEIVRSEEHAGHEKGLPLVLVPEETVVLARRSDDTSFDGGVYPEISQGGMSVARSENSQWTIFPQRVKYGVACQIVFTPLRGNWRKNEWN